MWVVTGGRSKGRRKFKLGNVFFTVMAVAILAVLITAAMGGMEAAQVEASGTRTLGSLELGDRVIDPSWEWEFRTGSGYYYQDGDLTKPVTWTVVAKDHYGADTGVTLLSEELIGRHAFDNSDHVHDRGYNHWGESGIHLTATLGLRPWLNSTGIHEGEGFYNEFSESFKNAIIPISLPNKVWDTSSSYLTLDNVFIPSTTELGDTLHAMTYKIGMVYPYFEGAKYLDRSAQLGESSWWYWTRSPSSSGVNGIRIVAPLGGFINLEYPRMGYYGVRPALNLRSDATVSTIPNDEDIYIIKIHSSDAELSFLEVDPGELDPVFDKDIISYSVDVEDYVESIFVTATLSDENAGIIIDGDPATSGEPKAITLNDPGTTTEIEIVIKAEDGETKKTYTVEVKRSVSYVEEVNLTAGPPNWQLKGEDITFTAGVTEGNQNAEFAFWYRVPGRDWVNAKEYSTENTWTTSTSYVGEATVGVQARAKGSDVFEEARDWIDYEIVKVAPVEEVKLSADPEGSQQAGEYITFTAEVTEGNTNAEFAFYYQLPGTSWTLGRSYSEDNTWKPKTNYVGEAKIGVIARAVGSDHFEEARAIIEDYKITTP